MTNRGHIVTTAGVEIDIDDLGGSLPAGGTTGEVLTKLSNADGDADWEAGGGSQTVYQTDPIHITAADFLSATTVYPQVVAGVAGKAIVPISGIMQFNAGGTPFDGSNQQLYDLIPADSYAIPEFASAIWGIQWLVDITSPTHFVKVTTINDADQFALLPAQVSGKALVFSSESANPTVGNGTADLTVLYYLATIL